MLTKPDCCSHPSLKIIDAIPDESDAKVSIQQCETCRAYRQVVADQMVMDGSDLVVWDWYQPVTEEQAESVLACMAPS